MSYLVLISKRSNLEHLMRKPTDPPNASRFYAGRLRNRIRQLENVVNEMQTCLDFKEDGEEQDELPKEMQADIDKFLEEFKRENDPSFNSHICTLCKEKFKCYHWGSESEGFCCCFDQQPFCGYHHYLINKKVFRDIYDANRERFIKPTIRFRSKNGAQTNVFDLANRLRRSKSF